MRRTFLALPLAEDFRDVLAPFLRSAADGFDSVRWVPPENVHVTLHFFGPTPETELERIHEIASEAAAGCQPVALSLEGIGFFPDAKRPRIVWIGVADGAEEVGRLHRSAQREIKRAGFPIESRAFRAHATVGRVRRGARLHGKFSLLRFPRTEVRTVRRIIFYESILAPGGARYEPIGTFPLGAPGTA